MILSSFFMVIIVHVPPGSVKKIAVISQGLQRIRELSAAAAVRCLHDAGRGYSCNPRSFSFMAWQARARWLTWFFSSSLSSAKVLPSGS